MAICAYGLGAIDAPEACSHHGHSDFVLGNFGTIDAHYDAASLSVLADATGYARQSWSERLHSSFWRTFGADGSYGGIARSTHGIVFRH
jgi:hypothetical protein